jgi:hypothetical protein
MVPVPPLQVSLLLHWFWSVQIFRQTLLAALSRAQTALSMHSSILPSLVQLSPMPLRPQPAKSTNKQVERRRRRALFIMVSQYTVIIFSEMA